MTYKHTLSLIVLLLLSIPVSVFSQDKARFLVQPMWRTGELKFSHLDDALVELVIPESLQYFENEIYPQTDDCNDVLWQRVESGQSSVVITKYKKHSPVQWVESLRSWEFYLPEYTNLSDVYVMASKDGFEPVFRKIPPAEFSTGEMRVLLESQDNRVALNQDTVYFSDDLFIADPPSAERVSLVANRIWGAAVTFPLNLKSYILSHGILIDQPLYTQEKWNLMVGFKPVVDLDFRDPNQSLDLYRVEPGYFLGERVDVPLAVHGDYITAPVTEPGLYFLVKKGN